MRARGLVVVAGLALLAGCAQAPPPGAATTPASPSPTPSASATAKPSVTAAPSATTARPPASPSPALSSTPGTTPAAGVTPSPTPVPTRTATPTAGPNTPAVPGRKWVGDPSTGYVAVPEDWQDCSADGLFGVCDPTLGYKLTVTLPAPADGQTAEALADQILAGFETDKKCEDAVLLTSTKNGIPVYAVGAMCQNQQAANVIDDPAGVRLFTFEGPGGVAFDAYYQPTWSSYTW